MLKVLLADDDFTMVDLLKTLLGMEGYTTVSLLDKKGDILENIREEKPDIFILDVHLGSRNGLELLRQVRNSPDLKNIRVIMVSGMDREEECLAAGANDFLLKPYMPEELFSKLRAM
jgi:DNA-binding response OmpR family regulator